MPNLVVDSSVVIKWFVIEPYSSQAHLILKAYQAGTMTLLAPDMMNAEVGNIVWKKQMFQGLAASDAQLIISAFRRLTFVLTPTGALLDDAYKLAVKHQRAVYDMMYLALSIRERCQFVTADERMVNSLSPTFSNIVWLANWT